MVERDLLKGLAGPALNWANALLVAAGLPGPLHNALALLVDLSGLILIAAVFGGLGVLHRSVSGRAIEQWLAAGSGLVALVLAGWLAWHPSDHFDGLFRRWDHLAFAGAAGLAIAVLGGTWRKFWLAAVSNGILWQYAGPLTMTVVVSLTAIGVALLRTPLRSHRAAMIALQATLVVMAYGFAFWLRTTWSFIQAANLQGLLIFWMLRHISLIVSAWRTGPPSVADCSTFMSFYPGAMGLLGAPEVYDEFARRNLTRPPLIQHRRAARRIIDGILLLCVSTLIPINLERIESSTSIVEAWACCIALFVRTALAMMGAWRALDGTSLLYGVQLRANFAGLLTCRNPSELWWSWRGTLTNWLVQHVYGPLGGRRRPVVNIAATFAVSCLWHLLGIPFLSPEFQPSFMLPVILWAAINAVAVIAHAQFERAVDGRVSATRSWLRTAVATVLTWALGSLTPILLHYQGPAVSGLPHLLRLLLGLG